MKNIIWILLAFAQCAPPQSYDLTVSVQSCNPSDNSFLHHFFLHDFFLHDLHLKKGAKMIQPQNQMDSLRRAADLTGQYEFQFTNLDSKQYTLEFTNFYNQKVSQIIDLEGLTTKIKICSDTFVYTHEPTFFEKMTPKDSLICEFKSKGCFSSHNESYKFQYEKGVFIGTFINDELKVTRKILTQNDLAYLVRFEKQLRQVCFMDGHSTTRNTFTLRLNGKETISIEDKAGRWNGEADLKKKIFGIVPPEMN
jgi:hypothetical protein